MAAVIGCRGAVAHPAVRCAAFLKVDEQGRGTLTLHFDVLSFVLNEEPSKADDAALWRLVDGPDGAIRESLEEAAGRLARHAFVRADGTIVPVRMAAFPSAADLEKWKADVRTPGERPRLPWLADAVLAFDVPLSAGAIEVQFPEMLGDLVLAFESPGREAQAVPLAAGVRSEAFSLRDTGGDEPRHGGFVSFVRLGIEHIVPQGLDHMLFILGLFLASPRVKSLLVMVTMFTLAHSVTLALAATGIVVAPPRVVEPLIALSIVAVAIENIFSSKELQRGRTLPPTPSLREGASALRVRAAIVFVFGLVHGLGFASVFKEMELPRSVLVPALVGFNVGVEVGQLIVLSGAFVVVGWAGRKSWYRSAVVIPGSAAIACVGLYWAVTRVMGA